VVGDDIVHEGGSMSTATIEAPPTRRTRDARRFRRLAAAAILPVPALAIATQPLYRPAYGELDTAAALEAVAASPGAQALFVWTGALALLTLVPAVLAAARLARRQRPVLATWAAGVNLAAYLGAALGFGSFDLANEVAARPDFERATMVAYIDAFAAHGVFGLGIGLFVLGHIAGAVLLGLALWGIVPRWASVALTISQPLHFVAFVILQNRYLDAVTWGLTALGLIACAVVVLRTPDDEWDLPPQPPVRAHPILVG
jgi:hypothetical protein